MAVSTQRSTSAHMPPDVLLAGSRAAVAGIVSARPGTAQCSDVKGYPAVGSRDSANVFVSPSSPSSPFRSSPTSPHTDTSDVHDTPYTCQQLAIPRATAPTVAAAAEYVGEKGGPLTVSRRVAVTGCLDDNRRCPETGSVYLEYSKTECEQRDVQFALQDTATNDGMVDLSNRQLARLHPNIGIFAGQLTQINLSNNALRELPDEIGLLRQLQHINLSKNALQMLPSAIAFWQNLQTLDVGDNSLTDLPSAARHLDKLEVLNLAANKFVSVPDCLCRLQMLRFLDLSHNQIDVLPARMFIHGGSAAPNRGRLELLLVEGCPLISKESPPSYDCSDIQRSAIPSLVDTVLHQMIVSNVGYPFGLPEHLQQRLNSFVACDYCHRLYPAASAIKRRSFVCRDKIELPIEYNLCQAHWYDEKSRIAAMFAPRVPEHARDYYKAKQLALALTKLVLAEDNGPPGSGSSTRLLPVKILPRQGLGRRVADAILRKKKHHARDKEAPAFSRQDRPAQTIWQVFEDDIH